MAVSSAPSSPAGTAGAAASIASPSFRNAGAAASVRPSSSRPNVVSRPVARAGSTPWSPVTRPTPARSGTPRRAGTATRGGSGIRGISECERSCRDGRAPGSVETDERVTERVDLPADLLLATPIRLAPLAPGCRAALTPVAPLAIAAIENHHHVGFRGKLPGQVAVEVQLLPRHDEEVLTHDCFVSDGLRRVNWMWARSPDGYGVDVNAVGGVAFSRSTAAGSLGIGAGVGIW